MTKYPQFVFGCIGALGLGLSSNASAVGGGLEFTVQEGIIPAAAANVPLVDSIDFTYHSCVELDGPSTPTGLQSLYETGYFFASSYQDVDSVVDSQLNHFAPNGYRIYAFYKIFADLVPPAPQVTPSGERLNYVADYAAVYFYLDPLQDTTLGIADCSVTRAGANDDRFLGSGNVLAQGELSETDGLANGDFKMVIDDFQWTPTAGAIFNPLGGLSLDDFKVLVFNANRTNLGGPLGKDHDPEGSGNVFWLESFESVGMGF